MPRRRRSWPRSRALLAAELRSDHPFVDELVRYGCLLGGKRLRPALLLLTAKAGGRVTPSTSRWRRSSR